MELAQQLNDNYLMELFKLNTARVQQQILSKLKENPSKVDVNGCVYGFGYQKDNNTKTNFWVKLGRTTKMPEKRIQEWNGEHVFSKKTDYNRKLERLIHLFFKFANVERVVGVNREIEWFHFVQNQVGTKLVTENFIVRIVSQIDDLMNEVHELLQIKKESIIITRKKSIVLKHHVNPILPSSTHSNLFEINEIISNYNSSNYFHVGPRREIFDTLKKCFAEDSDNIVTSAEQKREILQVDEAYNLSTYFHVGPRRKMFDIGKIL